MPSEGVTFSFSGGRPWSRFPLKRDRPYKSPLCFDARDGRARVACLSYTRRSTLPLFPDTHLHRSREEKRHRVSERYSACLPRQRRGHTCTEQHHRRDITFALFLHRNRRPVAPAPALPSPRRKPWCVSARVAVVLTSWTSHLWASLAAALAGAVNGAEDRIPWRTYLTPGAARQQTLSIMRRRPRTWAAAQTWSCYSPISARSGTYPCRARQRPPRPPCRRTAAPPPGTPAALG